MKPASIQLLTSKNCTQDDSSELNGNFNRSSKTLDPVRVDLDDVEVGHRGRAEISFASTQTEAEKEREEEKPEVVCKQTEERESQTEGQDGEEEERKARNLNENGREEKETWTEILSQADNSCQTDEAQILAPKVREEGGDEVVRPASGGGRISACTQTLSEGMCEVQVQTDIEDGSAHRTVSYPQSPADQELVNLLIKRCKQRSVVVHQVSFS